MADEEEEGKTLRDLPRLSFASTTTDFDHQSSTLQPRTYYAGNARISIARISWRGLLHSTVVRG
jgi:hypothetical protein